MGSYRTLDRNRQLPSWYRPNEGKIWLAAGFTLIGFAGVITAIVASFSHANHFSDMTKVVVLTVCNATYAIGLYNLLRQTRISSGRIIAGWGIANLAFDLIGIIYYLTS